MPARWRREQALEGLSLNAKTNDGVLTVFAQGDMDLAHADPLWDEVSPLVTPGSDVVFDCSGVTFLDSAGLRTLLKLADHAGEVGARFQLGTVSAVVRRVLELAKVQGAFAHRSNGADVPADPSGN
jgi:anti-anti-sigma factor